MKARTTQISHHFPVTEEIVEDEAAYEQSEQQLCDAAVPSVETELFNDCIRLNDEGTQNKLLEETIKMDSIENECEEETQEAACMHLNGSFEPLDVARLMELGIPSVDITKLRNAGIFTVAGVQMQCKKDLSAIKGLSEAKVEKIIECAKKLLNAGFITGSFYLEQRRKILKITTGSKTLDTLLGGGGLESMAITEAFGEFRTGKTQLSHTLCVTCQLPFQLGGSNGKVIFIDTESTFRPERIHPIAERFGLDTSIVLDNILVARAYTHEHQMQLMTQVAAKMSQEPFGLIIVDSITALLRVDFSGRGELAERQQKLAKMMSVLLKLAEEFNVAVFITNQVVADPGGASMFTVDPKKPIGGHILAHASTTRLSLRKGRGDQRICKVYASPTLPEEECIFSISERGIIDAQD